MDTSQLGGRCLGDQSETFARRGCTGVCVPPSAFVHRHHAISRFSYPARHPRVAVPGQAAFGIALLLCAVSLAWLPGEPLAPAYMGLGYVFCLSTTFALAKFVRDRAPAPPGDVALWHLVIWGGLATAIGDGLGSVGHGGQPDLQRLPGRELDVPHRLTMMLRYCYEADMVQAGLQGRREAGEGSSS